MIYKHYKRFSREELEWTWGNECQKDHEEIKIEVTLLHFSLFYTYVEKQKNKLYLKY